MFLQHAACDKQSVRHAPTDTRYTADAAALHSPLPPGDAVFGEGWYF